MYLETPRLLLREFTLADISGANYLRDKEVMEWIEPAFSPIQMAEFITHCGLCHPPLIYALVEKESQALVGHVIFHAHHSPSVYELGWILAKEYWGRGYAYEISSALLHYAFTSLPIGQIVAQTTPENAKATALLVKLGMEEGEPCNGLRQFSIKNPQ